jgi:hypothetical protein
MQAQPVASNECGPDGIRDAALIIRRLIVRLRKSDKPGDQTICLESFAWLQKHGLEGSITRRMSCMGPRVPIDKPHDHFEVE